MSFLSRWPAVAGLLFATAALAQAPSVPYRSALDGEVRQGETVRLRVKNAGKVMHELVIGTKEELDQHAALMAKHPNMEHDEPYMAHVKPGQTGDLVWNFNRAGEFDYACLVPGHYQAGMTGKIRVLARKEQTK